MPIGRGDKESIEAYENVGSPHELHRRLGQYLKNAKKS
jgi:hypothetical protein